MILNHTHNIIHTEEGRLTTLICTVKKGIPPESLSFYRDGEIVMNGSGKVTFSFIPESSDHLNIYVCRAKHDALDNPLEVSIQLILAREYPHYELRLIFKRPWYEIIVVLVHTSIYI